MCRKEGYGSLQFNKIGKKEFEEYVQAVRKSADKDYDKMVEIIQSIFPE